VGKVTILEKTELRSLAVKKFAIFLSALGVSAGIASAKCNDIAILQAQAALVSTKEGKAADEDLNNRLGAKAADLKKRQDELQQLQDKLNRGGNTMSDAAKAQLQKDFDTKNKTFGRDKQDFEDEANAETNKAKAGLIDKMKKVIDQYQKDHNYCLILDVSDPQTPVIAFADEIDITAAVIEAYDKAQGSATTAKPSASTSRTPPPAAGVKSTPAPPAASGTKPPAPPAAKQPAPATK